MLLTDTKDAKADIASTDDGAKAPAVQAVPAATRPATPRRSPTASS